MRALSDGRVARAGEHRTVVVALQQRAHGSPAGCRCMCGVIEPSVGEHAEPASRVDAAQLQRLLGIVGDRERMELELADRDRLAVAGEADRAPAAPAAAARARCRGSSTAARRRGAPAPARCRRGRRARGSRRPRRDRVAREPGARKPVVELAQREAAVDQEARRPSHRRSPRRRVALPVLPLPRLQKRTRRVARGRYFRSSTSRLTMRLPASPFSGVPCALSTATVLASPSELTVTR